MEFTFSCGSDCKLVIVRVCSHFRPYLKPMRVCNSILQWSQLSFAFKKINKEWLTWSRFLVNGEKQVDPRSNWLYWRRPLWTSVLRNVCMFECSNECSWSQIISLLTDMNAWGYKIWACLQRFTQILTLNGGWPKIYHAEMKRSNTKQVLSEMHAKCLSDIHQWRLHRSCWWIVRPDYNTSILKRKIEDRLIWVPASPIHSLSNQTVSPRVSHATGSLSLTYTYPDKMVDIKSQQL